MAGGGMKIEFVLENDKELAAALGRLQDLSVFFSPAFSAWTIDTTSRRLAGMGNYPPPPPGSTYVRTGEFGSSWSTEEMAPSKVEFLNLAPHADPVAGEQQAWMHRGRWWVAIKRIEEDIPVLLTYLEKALSEWDL